MGQLTDEQLLPDVHISSPMAVVTTGYEQHMDHNYNTSYHKVICAPAEMMRIEPHTDMLQPSVMAIVNVGNLLTLNDIIIYPICPDVEVDYSTSNIGNEVTFLYPYQVEDKICVYVWHVQDCETISMYTDSGYLNFIGVG